MLTENYKFHGWNKNGLPEHKRLKELGLSYTAWEALKTGRTKYEPTAGDYELREEICKKLKQNNNSITGASLAGSKAMTATASAGYYMQEGICPVAVEIP